MNKLKCKICKRMLKLSRAVFPYGGDRFDVCVACLGKIEHKEREEQDLIPRQATLEQALKYLTSRGM